MVASPAEALIDKPSVTQDFARILEYIRDEDYDRCAASALAFVTKYKVMKGKEKDAEKLSYTSEAANYGPYAEFFQLFASAYQTWQGSYHYTPIRAAFRRAHSRLRRDVAEFIPSREDHALVVKALRVLRNMLLWYVWCENSTINNDPFALVRHSAKAIHWETRGRKLIETFSSTEDHLIEIVKWLGEYFEKNFHLHVGLNACARIYSSILRDRACPDFDVTIQRANQALEELTPRSAELSSELNAHIRYVTKHYERLMAGGGPPTYLRVRSGKLVLSLSAACDRAGARRILDAQCEAYPRFKKKTETALANLGLEVHSFRASKLMDIFETSFGESFLKSLTFDVGSSPVQLQFLEGPQTDSLNMAGTTRRIPRERSFNFDVRVTLSALGTCTVSFEMPIKADQFPDGLSVEEIRALQCCICPHAGQVRVQIERVKACKASPARFFDRADIQRLIDATQELCDEVDCANEETSLNGQRVSKQLVTNVKALKDQLDRYAEDSLTTSPSKRGDDDKALCRAINSLIDLANTTKFASAAIHVGRILGCCHRHRRLSDFGVEILDAVEEAFRSAIALDNKKTRNSEETDTWLLRPDLGWYAYLYATRIDEVTVSQETLREEADAWLSRPDIGWSEHVHVARNDEVTRLEVRKKAVGFDQIKDHPDTRGLVVDQREARTSFDDWRFMTPKTSYNNLALVRSHATDAFFTSEFQTFFYFPDVHQYIADQYEETVKLNLRLNIGLRFYNWRAEVLTGTLMRLVRGDSECLKEDKSNRSFRRLLKPWNSIRKAPGIRDFRLVRRLKREGERIQLLRSDANELHNLLFKAGISRYQDHGELMKSILDETKAEAAAQMTGRHLAQLDELNRELMQRVQTSRTMWFTIAASLVAASVTKDFFEGLVGLNQEFFEATFHASRESIVFGCMAFVLFSSITIGWILLKKPSAE